MERRKMRRMSFDRTGNGRMLSVAGSTSSDFGVSFVTSFHKWAAYRWNAYATFMKTLREWSASAPLSLVKLESP